MKLASVMYLVILQVLFTRDFFLPVQLLFYQCLVCLPVAEDREEFKAVWRITILGSKGIEGKDFTANKIEYSLCLMLIMFIVF